MLGYDTARWEFEGAQEATIYLTPAEQEEKQAVLNSVVRSMLDNMATPNVQIEPTPLAAVGSNAVLEPTTALATACKETQL